MPVADLLLWGNGETVDRGDLADGVEVWTAMEESPGMTVELERV